jgi:hypothetical protein
MAEITGIQRLDETIQPVTGVGDNWHMSWAKNDKQYVGLCDGSGWNGLPGYTGTVYNSNMYLIRGQAPTHSFETVPGYPVLESYPPTADRPKSYSRYYGFGILALDHYLYHFMSTPKEPFGAPNNAFAGVKLIYSADDGQTWQNQDGAPIRWEEWDERSPDNMLFFKEPDECFSLLTVLQVGQNYADNTDGYVYIYAPNGSVDGKMNQLALARAHKSRILQRSQYEYFVSTKPDGTAQWHSDIQARGIVHTFPKGWVNWAIGGQHGGHPYAWQPSVVYNRALNSYMMFNWGIGVGPDGDWFEKPSYLGFWTAPKPWGPWTQVHEDTAWTPGNDQNARCYQPQISPKWISDDGKSFWMVWTDFQLVGDQRPYYAFNCQKVNILTD